MGMVRNNVMVGSFRFDLNWFIFQSQCVKQWDFSGLGAMISAFLTFAVS